MRGLSAGKAEDESESPDEQPAASHAAAKMHPIARARGGRSETCEGCGDAERRSLAAVPQVEARAFSGNGVLARAACPGPSMQGKLLEDSGEAMKRLLEAKMSGSILEICSLRRAIVPSYGIRSIFSPHGNDTAPPAHRSRLELEFSRL
jgi:hypothetical protein